MVSAAAIFALRGLPLVKVYDIGVFEHVAGAHVDTLVGGGRALSLIRFLFLRTFLLQSRGDGRVRRSICLNHFHSSPTRGPSRSCDIRSPAILSAIVMSSGFCEIGPMPACFSEQGGSHRRAVLRRRKRPEKSRVPLNKKTVLHAVDDTSPILVPKGTAKFTFGDHLRHLHEHAGTIPATLDEFGRCVHCVRRGWFKPDA